MGPTLSDLNLLTDDLALIWLVSLTSTHLVFHLASSDLRSIS